MKKNRCLNFLKGIACFGVIFAHAEFPGMLGKIVIRSILWSVPIFYMISGYYSYQQDQSLALSKIPKKIKNIFNITFFSIVLYLFLTISLEILKGNLLEWIIKTLSIKNIIKIVLLTDLECIHAPHLWFLPSLIYCYLLLYFVIKKEKINWIIKAIPILYLIRIITPIFPGFDWHYQQNVFTGAIPNFFLGYYIASKPNLKEKISSKNLLLIIAVSLCLNALGVFIKTKIDIFEIFTIILSISIFLYAEKNPSQFISFFFESVGIKYSLYIYVFHMLFVELIPIMSSMLKIDKFNIYLYVMPFIVSGSTLLFSILFIKGLTWYQNNFLIRSKQHEQAS